MTNIVAIDTEITEGFDKLQKLCEQTSTPYPKAQHMVRQIMDGTTTAEALAIVTALVERKKGVAVSNGNGSFDLDSTLENVRSEKLQVEKQIDDLVKKMAAKKRELKSRISQARARHESSSTLPE